MSTSTALTVVDYATGEILDVAEAPTEQLARFDTNAVDVLAQINEARGVVSDELVARLDRNAEWTLRVGDPSQGHQFEIKAPSPQAGTESYDNAALHGELIGLLRRNTISEQAARKAQARTLIVELEVPYEADLDQIARDIKGAATIVAGRDATIITAQPSVNGILAGIKALRKVPGTGAALDRAKRIQASGSRKAKVTLKTKEA